MHIQGFFMINLIIALVAFEALLGVMRFHVWPQVTLDGCWVTTIVAFVQLFSFLRLFTIVSCFPFWHYCPLCVSTNHRWSQWNFDHFCFSSPSAPSDQIVLTWCRQLDTILYGILPRIWPSRIEEARKWKFLVRNGAVLWWLAPDVW